MRYTFRPLLVWPYEVTSPRTGGRDEVSDNTLDQMLDATRGLR